MTNKALFLDRDGIINQDSGYLYKIEDCIFVDGIFELCQRAQLAGYQIFVITNQSGIARGLYDVQQMHQLHQWMKLQFKQQKVVIKHIYFCPHHAKKGLPPYNIICRCRKPEPGLLLEAALQYELELSQSVLVGDKNSDMQAAQRAAIPRRILLQSQYNTQSVSATEVVTQLNQIEF